MDIYSTIGSILTKLPTGDHGCHSNTNAPDSVLSYAYQTQKILYNISLGSMCVCMCMHACVRACACGLNQSVLEKCL